MKNSREAIFTGLTDEITNALMIFSHKFYQLLLIAGNDSHKKSLLLKQIAESGNYAYVNLNLALSERLMMISSHERSLFVNQCMDEIINGINAGTVIFDHIEILFEKPLNIDPMALLKNLSRHRKLISAWPGIIKDNTLIYAKPGHPEYVKYPIEVDYTIIDIDQNYRANF